MMTGSAETVAGFPAGWLCISTTGWRSTLPSCSTAAQGRVFARIDPDGTRLTDLAERALITKQTAGFLVDQLERAGYVRRVPDPRDARARLVQIAERGRTAVEVARQTEAKVEAEWTAHLGEEATTQLRHALARLRDITDPYR
jgi:DNA-binding MarR family transcriptional regulator